MAKKKYYAVKKGKTPGIYNTWDECKVQVDGFSGAEYKSFGALEEAESYLKGNQKVEELRPSESVPKEDDALIAYVDGSYNDETKEFSYGMVIIHNRKEKYFSQKVTDIELAEMRNVAGEIKGAEAAMRYALDNGYKKLWLYHDYEGIAKWCTGEWQAKKEGTKAYQAYFNSIKDSIEIKFIKVQGHSNDKYNDMADELAKKAIFGIIAEIKPEEQREIKDNVYISRDLEELNSMLVIEGEKLWENFCGNGIAPAGIQQRFSFSVDGKTAKLDIYQRGDGSTTFHPTGANSEYSQQLKKAIEKQGLRNTSENKNYTMFLGEEWLNKTIEFLTQLPGVTLSENDASDKISYQFTSKMGDRLTLSLFDDFKVWVQGKPLYLYNEFLSFVSYSSQVTIDNIVEMTNAFVETNITVSDTRAKMSEILPKAYNSGKIDNTIWKLFSSSIVFIEDDKVLEDYSGCIFPALRALEAYLLFLLDFKNITIDTTQNFGSVFTLKIPGDKTSKHILQTKHKAAINDPKYEQALEDIYNYFRRTRHVYFHANQIQVDTRLIEQKQEACDIFYEIVNLIETTFIDLENLF